MKVSPVITSPPNLSLAQPMSTESFGQVATVVPLLSGILAAVSKKSSGSELEPTMSVLVTHFRQRPLLYTIAMDAALVLVT